MINADSMKLATVINRVAADLLRGPDPIIDPQMPDRTEFALSHTVAGAGARDNSPNANRHKRTVQSRVAKAKAFCDSLSRAEPRRTELECIFFHFLKIQVDS